MGEIPAGTIREWKAKTGKGDAAIVKSWAFLFGDLSINFGMHHSAHGNHLVGSSLNRVALSATAHCLAGCSIGEIAGMMIGAAAGLGNWTTVALSIALAFASGYCLTLLPLLRGGLSLGPALLVALASDTASIGVMEVVDNAVMLAVPGAMDAGLLSSRFWLPLIASLLLAGVAAFPVNRWLIARGRGHACVHASGHGGHPPQ